MKGRPRLHELGGRGAAQERKENFPMRGPDSLPNEVGARTEVLRTNIGTMPDKRQRESDKHPPKGGGGG